MNFDLDRSRPRERSLKLLLDDVFLLYPYRCSYTPATATIEILGRGQAKVPPAYRKIPLIAMYFVKKKLKSNVRGMWSSAAKWPEPGVVVADILKRMNKSKFRKHFKYSDLAKALQTLLSIYYKIPRNLLDDPNPPSSRRSAAVADISELTYDFTDNESTRESYLQELAKYKDSAFAEHLGNGQCKVTANVSAKKIMPGTAVHFNELELFFRQTRFAELVQYFVEMDDDSDDAEAVFPTSEPSRVSEGSENESGSGEEYEGAPHVHFQESTATEEPRTPSKTPASQTTQSIGRTVSIAETTRRASQESPRQTETAGSSSAPDALSTQQPPLEHSTQQNIPTKLPSTQQAVERVVSSQTTSRAAETRERSPEHTEASTQEAETAEEALNKEEFWNLYRSLESKSYISRENVPDIRLLVMCLKANLEIQGEFDRRRVGLKNRLYIILKDLVEEPWELRAYRGCRSADGLTLSVSFKYKNRPQFSGVKVDLEPKFLQESVVDIYYTISFTVRNVRPLTHSV